MPDLEEPLSSYSTASENILGWTTLGQVFSNYGTLTTGGKSTPSSGKWGKLFLNWDYNVLG